MNKKRKTMEEESDMVRQLAKDFNLRVTNKSTKKELLPLIIATFERIYDVTPTRALELVTRSLDKMKEKEFNKSIASIGLDVQSIVRDYAQDHICRSLTSDGKICRTSKIPKGCEIYCRLKCESMIQELLQPFSDESPLSDFVNDIQTGIDVNGTLIAGYAYYSIEIGEGKDKVSINQGHQINAQSRIHLVKKANSQIQYLLTKEVISLICDIKHTHGSKLKLVISVKIPNPHSRQTNSYQKLMQSSTIKGPMFLDGEKWHLAVRMDSDVYHVRNRTGIILHNGFFVDELQFYKIVYI
jgi:hypothetical protein